MCENTGIISNEPIKPCTAKGVHETAFTLLTLKKGKILDAAAGKGALTQSLLDRGFEVYPVDIDPEHFLVSRVRCSKVDLNTQLPFEDNFFDAVMCIETIEHLENPWQYLREVYRVLKPNGQLIISTPNITNIFSRIKFLIMGNFFLFSKKDVLTHYHIEPIPYWKLEAMLQYTGFEIVKKTCSPGYLPYSGRYFNTKSLYSGGVF